MGWGLVAAWLYSWIWNPMIMLTVAFPLLLFPTGRSLSPRWRPVTWLAIGLTVAWTVMGALNPSLDVYNGTISNPIGVTGADPNAGLLSTIVNGLTILVLGAAIGSLVVRFRRSRGVERQQLKWFAYAGVLVVLAPLSTQVAPRLGNLPWVMVCALPVAVGIAVLRYRLYDIDRLINRTLVYGSLTAIVGLGYAGAVLVLGQVFGGVRGNPPSWAWPAPASTEASTTPPRPSRRSHPPARANRPRYPLHRAAGGHRPDHGADPGLVLASTSTTRLRHSFQRGTAHSLGLLSTTSGLCLQAVQASNSSATDH